MSVLSVERVERDRMKDEEGEERKRNGDEERERTNLSHNRKQSNAVIDFLKHHQRKFLFLRERRHPAAIFTRTHKPNLLQKEEERNQLRRNAWLRGCPPSALCSSQSCHTTQGSGLAVRAAVVS